LIFFFLVMFVDGTSLRRVRQPCLMLVDVFSSYTHQMPSLYLQIIQLLWRIHTHLLSPQSIGLVHAASLHSDCCHDHHCMHASCVLIYHMSDVALTYMTCFHMNPLQ